MIGDMTMRPFPSDIRRPHHFSFRSCILLALLLTLQPPGAHLTLVLPAQAAARPPRPSWRDRQRIPPWPPMIQPPMPKPRISRPLMSGLPLPSPPRPRHRPPTKARGRHRSRHSLEHLPLHKNQSPPSPRSRMEPSRKGRTHKSRCSPPPPPARRSALLPPS